jgi:hypothetical protein
MIAAALLLCSIALEQDTCSVQRISEDNPRLALWHRQLLAQLLADETLVWEDVLPAAFEAELLETICDQCQAILRLDSSISALEKAGMPGFQAEVSKAVVEKRGLSNVRDAAILDQVPAAHRSRFQEVLNPKRPEVFHFGIHDRLNCVVCVPGMPVKKNSDQ